MAAAVRAGTESLPVLQEPQMAGGKTEVKMKLSEIKVSDSMLELRPLDAFTVSRYRQHVRTGVEFPAIVLDKDGGFVVSGNHRYAAYCAEWPEDTEIEVKTVVFSDNKERIEFMARENMAHGMPMDGITRRRVALALANEGATMGEISALFNVPVNTLVKWGERTVCVIGKGQGRGGTVKACKAGPDLATGQKITPEEYETHIKCDMGTSARHMAAQIVRWLGQGWINMEDERNVNAMQELREALAEV
jgi:hypothetical protein